MLIAGNITPIDVVTHLPVLCEEHDIPYVFVPRKEDLGAAAGTKRPTSVILVKNKEGADHSEYFEEVGAKIKAAMK
jgi:H/ACA ribonucleoprotein complex subunit 2